MRVQIPVSRGVGDFGCGLPGNLECRIAQLPPPFAITFQDLRNRTGSYARTGIGKLHNPDDLRRTGRRNVAFGGKQLREDPDAETGRSRNRDGEKYSSVQRFSSMLRFALRGLTARAYDRAIPGPKIPQSGPVRLF